MNELEPLHITGNCKVVDLSEADRMRLASVSEYLDVSDSAGVTLPSLATCGWLDARLSVGIDLPALESCNLIDAFGSKELSLPKLGRVSFWINASRSVGLDLSALTACESIDAFGATGLVISDELARQHNIPDSVRAAK